MYVRAAGRGTATTYRVAVPGMAYYGQSIVHHDCALRVTAM